MSAPLRSVAFPRREDDLVIAGVAGGFADQHGVDAVLMRAVLVVLTCAGGLGVLLYAFGAIVSSGATRATCPRPHPRDQRRDLATACMGVGALLIVRASGLWLGDAVMVPLVVIAAGVVLLSVLGGDALPSVDGLAATAPRGRLVVGGALVAVGLLLIGARRSVPGSVRIGTFAAAFTILGIVVVLGPWLTRTVQAAAAERRERIRVAEREAMAAHLHDSVLQTLALIQRTADDPRRTVTLARQQERELREWLYGSRSTDGGPSTLAESVRSTAAEVERAYDVRVEVVVVGDRPLDEPLAAVVAALREACINAAKHSGASEVSVFVEVRADAVEAFVRDRGRGFDRATAAPDRRGIASSIEGRLERVGGRATITTAPHEGTEVQLFLPLHDVTPDVVMRGMS